MEERILLDWLRLPTPSLVPDLVPALAPILAPDLSAVTGTFLLEKELD